MPRQTRLVQGRNSLIGGLDVLRQPENKNAFAGGDVEI